jgi:hypothetical protein
VLFTPAIPCGSDPRIASRNQAIVLAELLSLRMTIVCDGRHEGRFVVLFWECGCRGLFRPYGAWPSLLLPANPWLELALSEVEGPWALFLRRFAACIKDCILSHLQRITTAVFFRRFSVGIGDIASKPHGSLWGTLDVVPAERGKITAHGASRGWISENGASPGGAKETNPRYNAHRMGSCSSSEKLQTPAGRNASCDALPGLRCIGTQQERWTRSR